ncbi:MAG: DUF3343 domain-containing protein [Eubacteriales bacterium]
MESEKFYLICFASTQKAIYTERKMKEQIPGVRLVPIPPEISAGCGLGLKIALEDFHLVNRSGLDEEVFVVEKEGSKRKIQKMVLE